MAAIGQLVWHSSGPDEGPDVGREVVLAEGMRLWCGEISRSRWEEAGEDVATLGDDFGIWLILYTKTESIVLGRLANEEAADALANAIAGSLIRARGKRKVAPGARRGGA